MSHRIARSIILSLLILGLVSCGGDNPTEPGGGGGGGGGPTNVTISLSASGAMPGAAVPIDGIGANVDLDGAYMSVREPGTTNKTGAKAAEVVANALLGRDDAGVPYFVAPLRPADLVNGGVVELQLTGNNLISNSVPFTVEPLPAATSTVQDMVDNLQALMDKWLDIHGVTREELRTMDPSTMPAWMYPLWHAHEVLDNPDNPNSLRKIVDGPVPFYDNETIDFDITNRLLSSAGVNDFLSADLASVDSLPRLDTLTVTPTSPAHAPRLENVTRECNVNAGNFGIDTAGELDVRMTQASSGQERLESEGLSDWSWLVAGVGAVPLPQAKIAGGVLSMGTYVYKMLNDAAGKMLPSGFDYAATDFDVADNDFEYYEDDTGGLWLNFRVVAISEGWNLDREILKTILSLSKLFTGVQLPEFLADIEADVAELILNEAADAFVAGASEGAAVLEVCPGRWPVSQGMSGSAFSKSDIATGTSFEMSSHTFFETRGPGISELEVSTAPGRFGTAPPAKQTKSIEVIAIEVEVTPTPVTLKDDEKRSFDAVVKNASDDSVDWDVPAPLIEVSRSNFGKTIEIMAPEAPPQGPNWDQVILKARSQAKTGSREGQVDSDPRDGFAVINHKDSVSVTIDPSFACVMNGKDTTFTAEVTGTDTYTIEWSLQGFGSLDQTGQNTAKYTAPNVGTTDDIISATVVEHPNAKATADVHGGVCNCDFSVVTAGLTATGSDVAYRFSDLPSGFHSYQFFYELGGGVSPDVAFAINIGPTDAVPAPVLGETGTFGVQVSYFDGVATWTTNNTTATANVTINEHTETYMKGVFFGLLARGDDEDITISVTGTFRAGRWVDGGGWPCE